MTSAAESETHGRAGGRGMVIVIPVLLSVAALAMLVFGLVAANRAPAPKAYTYDVPAGTGARIDHGEAVQVIPNEMSLRTGDSLVVTNSDDRVHTVGLFSVRPGETVTKVFDQPGVFKGACTAHSSGEVTVTVT